MPPASQAIYEFGPFRLDSARYVLSRDSHNLAVPPKAFEILRLLLDHQGTLVSKNELQSRVWPDTFVEENNLAQHISLLRKILGETPGQPQYIETVPRVGYRFIGEARRVGNGHTSSGESVAASAVPVSFPGDVALPGAQSNRRVRPKWLRSFLIAAAVLFCVVAVAATAVVLLQPSAPASVLGYQQLTHDGYSKQGPLLTDGESVYFRESRGSREVVVRVPAVGGEPVPLLDTPLPLFPASLAPDRREMLLLEAGPGVTEEFSLRVYSLPNGPLRSLGTLRANSAIWAPRGDAIYAARMEKLYRARSDGSDPQLLLTAPGRIEWLHVSPDGALLRFYVQQGGAQGETLWEARSDGRNLRPLSATAQPETGAYGGTWTADGRYNIYPSTSDGGHYLWAFRQPRFPLSAAVQTRINTGLLSITFAAAASRPGQMFAVGTLDRVELLRFDRKTNGFAPYLGGISADGVSFTRRGDRVAYTTYPERTLRWSRVDGRDRRQLLPGSPSALMPVWSPDGGRIAYVARSNAGALKINLISSDGGTPEELLPGTDDEANPTWCLDAETLFYAGAPWVKGFAPGSTRIQRVDLRTRKVAAVPGSEGLWSPRCSPDGKYLIAETVDSRRLLLLEFASGAWSPLAEIHQDQIGYTSWSSDSRFVYFNAYTEHQGKLYRAEIANRHVKEIALPESFEQGVTLGMWFALAPDNSPLLLRDISTREIFALDLRLP